jgi:hypothetical protein
MPTSVAPSQLGGPSRPAVEVLLREAKRRQRIRRAWQVAVAVLLVVGLVLLSLYFLGATPRPRTGTPVGPDSITVLPADGALHLRGALQGISCPTTEDCWAVGMRDGKLQDVPGEPVLQSSTLIEHRGTGRWSVVESPTPPVGNAFDSGPYNDLGDISCPTPTWCVAAGNHGGEQGTEFNETWSGHAWELVPGFGFGSSLSCPRANRCVATLITAGGPFALAGRWNGSRWRSLKVPRPQLAVLQGVSCGTASSCWFVGSGLKNPGIQSNVAVADNWADGRWTTVRFGPQAGTSFPTLAADSCIGDAFCVAVGYDTIRHYVDGSASAVWDGASWRTLPTPPSGPAKDTDGLVAVACQSPTDCLAVGGESMELFNGEAWSPLALRMPKGLSGVDLLGVTAGSNGSFLVVGRTGTTFGNRGDVLIGTLNGRRLRLLQD